MLNILALRVFDKKETQLLPYRRPIGSQRVWAMWALVYGLLPLNLDTTINPKYVHPVTLSQIEGLKIEPLISDEYCLTELVKMTFSLVNVSANPVAHTANSKKRQERILKYQLSF